MSGFSPTALLSIVLGYLAFLFLVASVAEASATRLGRGRLRTLTYVLAASVYCTAWTFYGSVGLAGKLARSLRGHADEAIEYWLRAFGAVETGVDQGLGAELALRDGGRRLAQRERSGIRHASAPAPSCSSRR